MSINKKLSKKHREKISKALKKAHKNGNHPGWSHVNSSKNHMSRPERIFYNMLNESGLNNKYHIEYGFSVSKYFLDFAIIDFKIDIEIDGVQHIRNEKNIKHDSKRDKFLLEDNWKVYRISVY
jgi:very-short-patch-repair endonuclease